MTLDLTSLLSLLAPKGTPTWALALVGELFSGIVELVQEVNDLKGLSGDEKRLALVNAIRSALDELDSIPGWAQIDEAAKDRILIGMSELAYQILKATGGDTATKDDDGRYRIVRGAIRGAVRRLRAG